MKNKYEDDDEYRQIMAGLTKFTAVGWGVLIAFIVIATDFILNQC